MKHEELKKICLKHNDELSTYLESSKDEELYDSYNELNKAYKESNLNMHELEIYDDLVDVINEEIAYRWIKGYKEAHDIK